MCQTRLGAISARIWISSICSPCTLQYHSCKSCTGKRVIVHQSHSSMRPLQSPDGSHVNNCSTGPQREYVHLQKSKELAARLGTKSGTTVRVDATQLVSPYDVGLSRTPEITAIQSSGEAQFAISEKDVVYSRGAILFLQTPGWPYHLLLMSHMFHRIDCTTVLFCQPATSAGT